MPARVRPARSPTCATARRRSTPRRRSPMTRPTASPSCIGLPKEKVRAIWMFGTGSYGRNDQGDATADAAVLSKHLGRPVRVQYMRHEGTRLGPEGHGLSQPEPRRPRRLRQGDRLREHQQGVLAPRQQHAREQRGRRAGRPSHGAAAQLRAELRDPGRLLHLRSRPARLGDRTAADGARLAIALDTSARSLWPADPVRQRSRSSTRWRLRPIPIRSTSGCGTSPIRATETRYGSRPKAMAGRSGLRRATTRRTATWRSGAASRSAATSRPSSGSSRR